ncbi:hypothetical protein LSTR_LSTR014670 [Laodelphax striatellus]|uniref:Uncharacterized protein n=1 Tax=Laodelphax striatellus TaxID=195883 RepID=A0A482X065_LAOST|nr:hypothetical protein LSTR_LSTR014670 [Laodelphax striatellus]
MAVNGNHSTQPTSNKQHEAPCNNGNFTIDDVPIVMEETPVMFDHDYINSFKTTTEMPQDNTTDDSHLNETCLTQPTSDKQHKSPHNNLYGSDYINDVPIVTGETFVMLDDTIHSFKTTIIEDYTHLTLPSLENNDMDIELRLFDNTVLNDLDSESLTVLRENVNLTNLTTEMPQDNSTDASNFNDTHLSLHSSENNDMDTEIGLLDNTESRLDNFDNEPKMIKRKKRHQVNSSTSKINKWKENRKLGKEYVGRAKDQVDVKSKFIKKRCAQVMKQRCKCNRKDGSLL